MIAVSSTGYGASQRQAVLYLRVSTEEQVENYSLDTQADICKKEAERRGLEVTQIFREEGRSAKTIVGRPTLIDMLEYCRKHKRDIDAVIVYRLDRISRQTADYLAIRQKLTGCDITLVSASEPTGETPTEKFVETMLAGFAQMDNDVRGERAKNGLKARFMSGLHNGSVPLGYRRQSGYAATDPECFDAIKEAWELMATGTTSLRKLAELLNEKGVRDRRRGYKESLIRPQTLSGIFRNKFYAGKIVSKKHGMEVQGQHAPMITEELFYKVQSVIDGRLRTAPNLSRQVLDREDFPLRRIVRCSICRGPFTGAWSKGHTRLYGYYFCQSRCYMGKSMPIDTVEREVATTLTKISLKPATRDLIAAYLRKSYQLRLGPLLKMRNQAEVELKRLYELRQALIQKNLSGIYSDEIFKEQNKLIEEQLKTVHATKDTTVLEKYNLEALISFVYAKFGDLNETYLEASLQQKKFLLSSIFPAGLVWTYPGISNSGISPFYRDILDVQDRGVSIGADERTRTFTGCPTSS
jgi:site-specific DNA recombinase